MRSEPPDISRCRRRWLAWIVAGATALSVAIARPAVAQIIGTNGKPWPIFRQNGVVGNEVGPVRDSSAPRPPPQTAPRLHPGLESLIVDRLTPLFDELQQTNDRLAREAAGGPGLVGLAAAHAAQSERFWRDLLRIVVHVRQHNVELGALDLGNSGLTYYLSPEYFRTSILAQIADRLRASRTPEAKIDFRWLRSLWLPLAACVRLPEPFRAIAATLGLEDADLGRDTGARWHFLVLLELASGERELMPARLTAMTAVHREMLLPLELPAVDPAAPGDWIATQLGRTAIPKLVSGVIPVRYEGGAYVHRSVKSRDVARNARAGERGTNGTLALSGDRRNEDRIASGLPTRPEPPPVGGQPISVTAADVNTASTPPADEATPSWMFLLSEWRAAGDVTAIRARFVERASFFAALVDRVLQRAADGEAPREVGRAYLDPLELISRLEPCLSPFRPEAAVVGSGLKFTDRYGSEGERDPAESVRAFDARCASDRSALSSALFWLQSDFTPGSDGWRWQGRFSGYRGLWKPAVAEKHTERP